MQRPIGQWAILTTLNTQQCRIAHRFAVLVLRLIFYSDIPEGHTHDAIRLAAGVDSKLGRGLLRYPFGAVQGHVIANGRCRACQTCRVGHIV